MNRSKLKTAQYALKMAQKVVRKAQKVATPEMEGRYGYVVEGLTECLDSLTREGPPPLAIGLEMERLEALADYQAEAITALREERGERVAKIERFGDKVALQAEAIADLEGKVADLGLTTDEFEGLGWNGGRSYVKRIDLDLEYSSHAELVEAYRTHVEG